MSEMFFIGPRKKRSLSVPRAPGTVFSLIFPIFVQRRMLGGEERSAHEIHARVPTRWTNANRPQSRDTSPDPGEAPREEGEKGRKRDTHAGGTTHDGLVICWTPHGHVVFHGHEVHTALYTSWCCPAACRAASGPCNFMAEADCVRLE